MPDPAVISAPFYVPLFAALIGGAIGGGIGFVANYARHRWDSHSRKIDGFCDEALKVADKAAAYWLEPLTSAEVQGGSWKPPAGLAGVKLQKFLKEASETELTELQIVTAQHRISQAGLFIRSKLEVKDQETFDKLLGDFFTATSGNDFRDRSGVIRQEQASLSQGAASVLVTHVRAASEQYFKAGRILRWTTFKGYLTYLWDSYGLPRRY